MHESFYFGFWMGKVYKKANFLSRGLATLSTLKMALLTLSLDASIVIS